MGSGRPHLRSLVHCAGEVEPSIVLAAPRRGRRRMMIALMIGWLALIGAGCWLLSASQANSRKGMEARLQTRVQYAANFVSIYTGDLLTNQRAQALTWFAAPDVDQSTLDRDSGALGLEGAVILDTHGHVLRTATNTPAPLVHVLTSRYSNLAGVFSMPDATGIAIIDSGGSPVLAFGVAYQTPSGRRVFAGVYALSETVLPPVLGNVLSSPGWQAYLVDMNGGLLTGIPSGGTQAGTLAQADPLLSAADRRAPNGSYDSPQGKQYYVTGPVAGTAWRIVVRDPEARLFTFLNGAGRCLAWLALAGLAVAGLAIIVLITRLHGRREQLIKLNTELARLAAIDPLTGPRNRRAIDEHLRAEDAIGRWGGEEFLVVLPNTDELVSRADSALYLGKAAGRDTVQVSSPLHGIAQPI